MKIHSECDGEGEERGIGWTIIGPRTNSNSDETTRSVWSYVRNGRFGDAGHARGRVFQHAESALNGGEEGRGDVEGTTKLALGRRGK